LIRLAANLSFLFTEIPFLERFDAAAKAGFRAVEFSFAYDVPPREIGKRIQDNGLALVLINSPPGDIAAGELGLAVLPGREQAARASFDQAMEYAVELGAPLIHLLAGKRPDALDREAADAVFLENIVHAADTAAKEQRAITLEPLNARDRPGYHLQSTKHARALIESSGRQNVKLQFDFYHRQISEGDLTHSIERNIDIIAHVQIASVPERAEPSLGEVAYANVLARLNALGYKGYIGCEYSPSRDTHSSLVWAEPYLSRQ
jgi:2-dehydrotetronate isomerase